MGSGAMFESTTQIQLQGNTMSGSKVEQGIRGQDSGSQDVLQAANTRMSSFLRGAATPVATTQAAGELEPGATTHVYPSIKNRSEG